MKKPGPGFHAPLMMIFLLCGGRAWAAPVRIAYSIIGPPVAEVWMAQETGAFKKYGFDVQLVYIPSSGTNVLEFEPVKGVDGEALVPTAIDNSYVEELVKEGFIERVFDKGAR